MNRVLWIDQLRGFCMMAILWFHTEMYYAGSDVTPYALYVGDVLATFFFLSGYLFLSGKPFSARSKMMTIVRRLIIPYFFFTLLFVLPKAIVHDEMNELSTMIIKIFLGQSSWFLSALIVGELLFVLLIQLTKGKDLYIGLFSILCLVLAGIIGNHYSPWLNPYNYWHINEAILACFLMSAGFLFQKHEHRFQQYFNRFTLTILLLIFLLLKLVIIRNGMEMVLGSIHASNYPVFIADLLVSILLMISIFRYIPKISFMQWTGQRSLVYYFICGGVPLIVAMSFNKFGWPYSGYLSLLMAFIVVYLLSSLLTFAIYKYLPFIIGK